MIRAKYNPAIADELLRLRSEEEFVAMARGMTQHTSNAELSTERLVLYLKRPDLVPKELQEEYTGLLKYKNDALKFKKLEKLMYNKATQVVVNANGYMEQVFRLTSYMDSLRKGYSHNESISRVIRTHFDPTHKSTIERGMEMIFPFASFTIKNMHYWADELMRNGVVGSLFRDVMTPIWDFDSYDQWDIAHRRSLQYQILAGNVVLNPETTFEQYVKDGELKFHGDGTERMSYKTMGMTLKLNPSIMDSIQLLLDPENTIRERVVAPLRVPVQQMYWQDADYLSEEENKKNRMILWMQMIPLVGTKVQSYNSGYKYYQDTHNLLNIVLPSLFSRTNLDSGVEQYIQDPNYVAYEDRPVGRDWRNRNQAYKNAKKYVPGLSDTPFSYPNYGGSASIGQVGNVATYRNGEAKLTRMTRKIKYLQRDVYKDNFTATGKSRAKLNMLPISPKTVGYQVKALWNHLG